MKYLILFVFLLVVPVLTNAHNLDASCPDGLYVYKAEVISVYDADTITVDIDLGFHTWRRDEKLRLFGINAPEVRGKTKKEGYKSRDWLRKQILGKETLIQTVATKHGEDKRGKYGRYLAVVFLKTENGCVNLNDELVNKGFAVKHNY